MLVELWQVGVFIVALSFLALTIYLIGALQGLSRTMEQLRAIVGANQDNIHSITKELNEISKNATSITKDIAKDMDNINDMVESLNNTSQMVEETVQLSRDNVILPIMGLVNLGQGIKQAKDKFSKKK